MNKLSLITSVLVIAACGTSQPYTQYGASLPPSTGAYGQVPALPVHKRGRDNKFDELTLGDVYIACKNEGGAYVDGEWIPCKYLKEVISKLMPEPVNDRVNLNPELSNADLEARRQEEIELLQLGSEIR